MAAEEGVPGRVDEVAPADPAPPPEVPHQPEASPTPQVAPPIPWPSLQPIHYVRTFDSNVSYVEVPEPDPLFARRYLDANMASIELAPGDSRIPEHVAAITDPVVLLLEGRHASAPPTRVMFSSSPFGDGWTVAFAWGGGDTIGVALPRAPHPDAKLTKPSKEEIATGKVRRLLISAVPPDFRPPSDVDVTTAWAPARLPDGATKVISGRWYSENPETSGVVISVDDTNARIHTISIHRDYLTWASISWVGDLDGDGIDEIGWGHGGIEDEAHFITHFHEGKHELLRLYAAGH